MGLLSVSTPAAQAAWIEAGPTDQSRADRQRSDFLAYQDSAGAGRGLPLPEAQFYLSALVASGANVKAAQELARHSTPSLTIGRYSHTRLHDLRGAPDGLPSLIPAGPSAESQRKALRATGTEDARSEVGAKGAHQGQQLGGEAVRNVASSGETISQVPGQVDKAQQVTLSADGEKTPPAAKRNKRGAGGIRTHESRICNPLP
jgi:hypothetical protein